MLRALPLALASVLAVLAIQPAGAGPAQTVTLQAGQTTAPAFGTIELHGSVSNGREHESVTIEAKDCGVPGAFFRGLFAVETHAGGLWSSNFYPGVTAEVRATWGDATSAPVTIRQVPRIFVRRLPGGRFEISISAKLGFWRKHVLFQQRVSGSWRTVKRVVLTTQAAGGTQVWTSARFRAAVPRGRQLRALLTADQARPCYAAGTSNPMRS